MINLSDIISNYDIPVVKFHNSIDNFDNFYSMVKNIEGEEGFVISWNNSPTLKIKGDWYLKIHKNKDLISSEKAVAELIMCNSLDDIKPYLLPEDLIMVNEYEDSFINRLLILGDEVITRIGFILCNFTRKEFALSEYITTLKPAWKALLFSVWDKHSEQDCRESVMTLFRKNCSHNKNFKDLKEQFFNDIIYEHTGVE
jgi:hypothetical protein